MKQCTKCKILKNEEAFYLKCKNKYLDSLCKLCRNDRTKKWRKKNPERMRLQNKAYCLKNKDRVERKKREHYYNNIEKYTLNRKINYEKNRKIRLINAKYYANQPKNKLKRNLNRRLRYKTDIKYRLECSLRSRINIAVKKGFKSKKTLELLGCTIIELKQYLESKFQTGMTWENHGFGNNKWHIDHIIPCAAFDLSDSEQQKICFNFSNLQPLWQQDNFRKHY